MSEENEPESLPPENLLEQQTPVAVYIPPKERILDNWIESYLEFTQHTEAPEKFHRWTAISTIAGALRRKVWIDEGFYQYVPNFYIVFVAEPGIVSKSTTVSIGMNLLRKVPGINFGPSAGTWQALVKRLADSTEQYPMPDGDFFPMSCLTLEVSELGNLVDPRNREMLDAFVALYDGQKGVWEKITKTSTSEAIENAWVNLIGCTTPAWVAENCSDYFSGGGFASRILFIYASKKRNIVAFPSRHIPGDFNLRRKALIHDLELCIARLAGEYKLTEEAYVWAEAWYEDHCENGFKNLPFERLKVYLARKQAHILRLSIVLTASKTNDCMIQKDTVIQATEHVTELEEDMPQVFGELNKESDMTVAADVLDFLRSKGRMKTNLLYREFMKIISYDTFKKVMTSLIFSGLVQQGGDGVEMYVEALNYEKRTD